jgi:hypothetical protein
LLDVWTRNLRLDEGLRRLDKELALGWRIKTFGTITMTFERINTMIEMFVMIRITFTTHVMIGMTMDDHYPSAWRLWTIMISDLQRHTRLFNLRLDDRIFN